MENDLPGVNQAPLYPSPKVPWTKDTAQNDEEEPAHSDKQKVLDWVDRVGKNYQGSGRRYGTLLLRLKMLGTAFSICATVTSGIFATFHDPRFA